ncbi:hypothetical protein GCM10022289_44990 [Pedobacter jeongneungensis]|uniref:Uncharacterized protein n=2 Tax=Pedobacter jeongneungensis TaxID=947309 RepID=A0ABP8BQC5_9SPHI
MIIAAIAMSILSCRKKDIEPGYFTQHSGLVIGCPVGSRLSDWRKRVSFKNRTLRLPASDPGTFVVDFRYKKILLSKDSVSKLDNGSVSVSHLDGGSFTIPDMCFLESVFTCNPVKVTGEGPQQLKGKIVTSKILFEKFSCGAASVNLESPGKVEVLSSEFKDNASITGMAGYHGIEKSSFENLTDQIRSDTLVVRGTSINNGSLFLADSTVLDDIEISGHLTIKWNEYPNYGAKIILKGIDFDKLTIPTYGVDLIIDPGQEYLKKVRLYQQVINRYKEIPDQRKKYDIQYQKMVNRYEGSVFVDLVEEHWNNYGYDKNMIFMNSVILMMICYVINLFVYPRVLHEGYLMPEFITADLHVNEPNRFKRYFYKGIYCLIYTGFIFWGVTLDLEKIKLSNVVLSGWIIIQYLTGIVCLAYMANIIIGR